MPRRTGLGRGLDALISAGERPASGNVIFIPIERIAPNPRQPRSGFDPLEMEELTNSIREHGILQPLIVTYDDISSQYTLIAGERRLIAARQAGLESVPAIIHTVNEQQRLELALIENLQRADLNPLEAAEAYRQLAEEFDLSHEEIARRVGKSRAAITNTLRLLKLPQSARQALLEGRISEGHARALLSLPTPQAQDAALQTILEKDLSVRQTEELIRRLSGHKTPSKSPSGPPPEITSLEERLRQKLGTKVRLRRGRKGGSLVIHFYSEEELEALLQTLLGE